MSEYQPLKWQIVTDSGGYQSIHETNEDGGPGDLVANVFGDHAALIAAAPALLAALTRAIGILEYDYDQAVDSGDGDWIAQSKGCLDAARAALRLAQPKEVDRG